MKTFVSISMEATSSNTHYCNRQLKCQSKLSMFKILFENFICLVLGLSLLTFAALGAWGIKYRIPAGPVKIVDLRKSKTDEGKYISFCASLADGNPIGFPGHAYVVWSTSAKIEVDCDYSLGFMPVRFQDQLPSLVSKVPGALVENVRGNTRNLDRLTVIVSDDDFAKSKQYSAEFAGSNFKAGDRDCVAFVNFIAAKLGIRTANPGFTFPQDYLRKLKELN